MFLSKKSSGPGFCIPTITVQCLFSGVCNCRKTELFQFYSCELEVESGRIGTGDVHAVLRQTNCLNSFLYFVVFVSYFQDRPVKKNWAKKHSGLNIVFVDGSKAFMPSLCKTEQSAVLKT